MSSCSWNNQKNWLKLWQFIYTQLLSVYLYIMHLSHITYRERSYYLLVFMYLCFTQQHQRILLKSSKTNFNSSKLTVASQTFHLLGKYLSIFLNSFEKIQDQYTGTYFLSSVSKNSPFGMLFWSFPSLLLMYKLS